MPGLCGCSLTVTVLLGENMAYLRNPPFDEKIFPRSPPCGNKSVLAQLYVAQTPRPDLIEAEVALMGTILLKDGALSANKVSTSSSSPQQRTSAHTA
jgi:hypothetical protein